MDDEPNHEIGEGEMTREPVTTNPPRGLKAIVLVAPAMKKFSVPELTQNTAIQLNRQVSLRPLSFADYLIRTRGEALGRAQGPEIR